MRKLSKLLYCQMIRNFCCKIAAVKMVSSQRFGVKLRKVEKSSTSVFSSVYPKHKNGGDITKY